MMHVIAGGMWLGTLTVIVIVGISAALKTPDAVRPGARVAEMINLFSPLALTCGGAIVLTGVGSSLMHLPSVHALWTTPYGVVLLLKLFFVALLLAAGAWNWRRMKPRLTGDNAIAPMRSSASLELMLGISVLAVTAVLVALELP
jgi:copper transport protein